jgi:hypothetical protein
MESAQFKYYDRITNNLNQDLLDSQNGDFLKYVLQNSPALKHGIVELRESPYDKRVDLMLCVIKSLNEPLKIINWFEDQMEERIKLQWENVYHFCRHWLEPNSLLYSTLENIYIVFDHTMSEHEKINPWIYLAFHKMNLDADTIFNIYSAAAPYLNNRPGQKTLDLLKRSIVSCRGSHWVFGYGLLHVRGLSRMRIGVCGFSSLEEVKSYLKRIQWPGDTEAFYKQCSFMDDYADSYVLALDFDETFDYKIGLECVVGKEHNLKQTGQMIEILNYKTGFDEDRSKAILQWPIHTKEIQKWVNHIKLSFTEKNEIEIKPYLYYYLEDPSVVPAT